MAYVGSLPAPDRNNDNEDEDDGNAVIDSIKLEEGEHLGNDDYLISAHCVLSNSTHVVVNVIESQEHNFAVGSEMILTRARAHELCRKYNDL
jgi:hypothetical protein